MAAKKFLRYVAGRIQEIAGTIISAGAGNDGDIPALDATGKLDISVMPSGLGPSTLAMDASEALSAGNLVNVHDVAGNPKARKADATAVGKEAHGFVLAAVASGAVATVYFAGQNTAAGYVTTNGGRWYLSAATPGVAVSAPPSGSGNVVQFVGIGPTSGTLDYTRGDGIILA